jgi:hypothetical protein
MSKSNTLENEWLLHCFNNATLPLIGDAAGLLASAAAGHLYFSLHTADPGEAGVQTTSEIAYTNYARIDVNRASGAGGFTVTNNSVSPASNVTFAASAGGAGGTVTHFVVGTAETGDGKILYSGTVTPNIVVSSGVTPILTTATAITED